ncbi:AsmA family protein [Niveibacterium sp.]|uniref:AsmA family protein n=1 Tax=Niveibacterium sp. TaxID=2017444 RepID=UPI0035B18319
MITRLSKVLGFLLGALSALALVLGLYLHASWDGKVVRRDLARQVRERTARPLAMEGTPRLAFRPWPTVVIEGLALGEREAPGIPLRIGRVEAGVALLPLLRGKLELRSLRLSDLDATLVRSHDGWSLSDLNRGLRLESPWPFEVRLEQVALERARIRLRDDALGHALTFERIHLVTGSLQAGSHGRVRAEASLTEGPGAASGGLTLDLAYLLDNKGYDIESATLGFRGDAWGATSVDGDLQIRSGRGDQGSALALQGIVLQAKGRLGTGKLQLQASAERLASQNDALALQAIKATLQLVDGNARTDASFETASIAPRTPDFPGEPLRATFRSQGGQRLTSGQLNARIAYRPQHGRIELDAIDARWRSAAPGAPEGAWTATVGGSAASSLLGGRVDTRLQVRVAESAMQFQASYEQSRSVPWHFTVDADRIDTGRISKALGLEGAGAMLAPIARLHGDGQLRIAALRIGPLQGSGVSAQLQTGDGAVGFDSLALKAYGGDIAGSARYETANRSLALDSRFTGVELAALAQDLKRSWPLRGSVSGRWSVQANGPDWPAIAHSLSGEGQFTLRPAQWTGLALDDFLRAVRPALKDRGAAERRHAAREQQAFEEFGAHCRFGGGEADCSELAGRTLWARIGGGGKVLLADGRLDWLVRTAVQSQGPIPRDLIGLRGITVPVRISGALRDPRYALDWQAAPPRPAPVRAKPVEKTPEAAPDSPATPSAAG